MKYKLIQLIFTFLMFNCLLFGQESNLEYRNGKEFMKLIIYSEKPYFTSKEPIVLKLLLKNIDVEKITVYARGISTLGHFQKNTELLYNVKLDEQSITNGNWEMTITKNEKGKIKWIHKFIIQIK